MNQPGSTGFSKHLRCSNWGLSMIPSVVTSFLSRCSSVSFVGSRGRDLPGNLLFPLLPLCGKGPCFFVASEEGNSEYTTLKKQTLVEESSKLPLGGCR